jgi:membrane-associated HD superfamily phosphohydrolase
VPLSRLEPETMYSFGRVSEISRDEVKFGKFVKRLRTRFSTLFNIILEKQLVLKGIMGPEDFQNMKNSIRYDFITNNYFDELKEAEILRERMSTLRELEEHVGTYYSREWVVKNVLQLNDEEWKEQKETMAQEAEEAPEEAEEE